MPDYLTISAAADIVGITRQTMSYHVDQKHLPSTEIAGRRLVKRADAERFAGIERRRGPKLKNKS